MPAPTSSRPTDARHGHGDPQEAVANPWLDRVARFGMVARGLVYAVCGVLTVWLGVSRGGTAPGDRVGGQYSVSQGGALHALASVPAGRGLLVVLAVGFAGFAFFQVVDTVFHARKEDERWQRVGHRVIAGWGVVIYGLGCAYAVNLAFAPNPGADQPKQSHQQYAEATARVMGVGLLGRVAIGLLGAILVGCGIGLLRRAVTRNFRDRLERHEMDDREWRLAMLTGSVGCLARAVAIGLVGGFVVEAAVTFDPAYSSGLDGTLRAVAHSPAGPWLLVPLGLGLLAYCGYVWFEARYRKV